MLDGRPIVAGARSAAIARKTLAFVLLAVLASPSVASPRPEPAEPLTDAEARDLLRRVERRYASLRSLSASFVQSYRSRELGQEVVETGKLFVKRPGRMRWDYRRPDKKVFLVQEDGTTLSYVPADLTAVRGKIPREAPHLRLLLGESDLTSTFEVTGVTLKTPRNPAARHLKLRPQESFQSIEMIYLEVDETTATVERVLVVDRMGNESDLRLEKVRENAALRDAVFRLRLRPGIVVRDLTGESGGR